MSLLRPDVNKQLKTKAQTLIPLHHWCSVFTTSLCTHMKSDFILFSVGRTTLYPVPLERPPNNSTPVNTNAIWISCVCVGVGLMIIGIIIYAVVKSRSNESHRQESVDNAENIRMNSQQPSVRRTASGNTLPPTYDEAMYSNK